MREAFLKVAEFEKLCGHELPDRGPSVESVSLAELRIKLISEESKETVDALSIVKWAMERGVPFDESDIAEIADGLADTMFVCIGTAIRLGIDLPEVWNRVCEANLKKFGEGSSRRADGKVQKPPGWQHPDILGVIKAQLPLRTIYGQQDAAQFSRQPADEVAGQV